MTEEIKPRKLMIVIEDDGKDLFSFCLVGDVERLNMPQIPQSLYSPAEFWAVEFMKACEARLRAESSSVKKLNREERRRQ